MQQVVNDGRKWAMFMVAGGHFAGAVVRVSRPDEDEENEDEGTAKKKKKPKKPKPDTEVLKHKTFHRYTSNLHLSSSVGRVDFKWYSSPKTGRVPVSE
jgi:hypothetical protein